MRHGKARALLTTLNATLVCVQALAAPAPGARVGGVAQAEPEAFDWSPRKS